MNTRHHTEGLTQSEDPQGFEQKILGRAKRSGVTIITYDLKQCSDLADAVRQRLQADVPSAIPRVSYENPLFTVQSAQPTDEFWAEVARAQSTWCARVSRDVAPSYLREKRRRCRQLFRHQGSNETWADSIELFGFVVIDGTPIPSYDRWVRKNIRAGAQRLKQTKTKAPIHQNASSARIYRIQPVDSPVEETQKIDVLALLD
jgi:hypothetical protein